MPWWQVLSTIVEGAAAAAVAYFAWATWRSDNEKRRQRAIEVESRISTIAFQLRRQMQSWLAIDPTRPLGLLRWLTAQGPDYGKHFDVAERRLEEMATLGGEASAVVRTRVSMAFVLFLGGTRRINQHESTKRPSGNTQFDYDRLLLDAEKDLKACIEALEDGVIDLELLTADRELDEIRNAENPFKVLADKMLHRQIGR